MTSDKDISLTAATEVAGSSAPAADGDGLPAGTRLGSYVIRRTLGVGGMGRVYLAEQLKPVHRDVALKVIHEQVSGPVSRAYFEVERQALAQMQHPAIAQVFDAGTTEEGQAYLVMELVEGKPITTFCDDEKLDVKARLGLFELLAGIRASSLTTQPNTSDNSVLATLIAADDSVSGSGATPEYAAMLAAARKLPRELRGVLRKALAQDRADRYASAVALADDLERYQRHQPLHALPATRGYVARKFVARHRFGLIAASLVGVALLAGIVLAVSGERRAQAAAKDAQTQTLRAEHVASFVHGMLTGIDPDQAEGLDTKLMRLVLDTAAKRAADELAAEPAVRASIEATIADTYLSIGANKQARASTAASLRALAAAQMSASERARLMVRAARVISQDGDPDMALHLARAALPLVASLADDDSKKLDVEQQLAWLEWTAGDLPASGKRFAALHAIRKQHESADSKWLLDSVRGMAVVASSRGDYARAQQLYQQLLAAYIKKLGSDSTDTLVAANELGMTEARQKHFADAERLYRKWVPIARKVYGPDHPSTMAMYSNLGGAIRQQPGRNAEARPYYERSLAYSLDRNGPDNYASVIAEINLAYLLRDAGQLPQAEQHARQAVAHMDKAFGTHDGYRGVFPDGLATVLMREHKYADAEQALNQAWAIFMAGAGYGPDHPAVQETVKHYVELYTAWRKPKLAAQWEARESVADAGAASAKTAATPASASSARG